MAKPATAKPTATKPVSSNTTTSKPAATETSQSNSQSANSANNSSTTQNPNSTPAINANSTTQNANTNADGYYGKQYSLSPKWTRAEIDKANTAKNVTDLKPEERNIYLWINLARLYPKKFADYEVVPYVNETLYPHSANNRYVLSLLETLRTMQPINELHYSRFLTEYAEEWAIFSGQNGETGHDRPESNRAEFNNLRYRGECCYYDVGKLSARKCVLELLVDWGQENLGHRNIVLSTKKILSLKSV